MTNTPCFLGSKFEYYLTNPRYSESAIANDDIGSIQGAVSKERIPFAKRMPEASDNGSQPYRNAVRCFEMAGMGLPPII